MANHTITIINKGSSNAQSQNNNSRMESSDKKTSASSKKKNKSSAIKPGTKKIPKGIKAGAKIAAAMAITQAGINIYADTLSAATGEEMRASNIKTMAGALINPIGFGLKYLEASTLGDLRVQRANQQLNYQRQLTGNLVYSRKFINGTF